MLSETYLTAEVPEIFGALMDQTQIQNPNRGLLDLDVTQSSPDVMAGQDFSMYVLVKNPFDKPIWIKRVHVSVPSEIDLPQWNAFKADLARKEEEKKQGEEDRQAAIKEEAKRRSELVSIDKKIMELEDKIKIGKNTNIDFKQKEQELQDLLMRREEISLQSEAFIKKGTIIKA